jgi:hypothetical protein
MLSATEGHYHSESGGGRRVSDHRHDAGGREFDLDRGWRLSFPTSELQREMKQAFLLAEHLPEVEGRLDHPDFRRVSQPATTDVWE